jgi:hypothetical protein
MSMASTSIVSSRREAWSAPSWRASIPSRTSSTTLPWAQLGDGRQQAAASPTVSARARSWPTCSAGERQAGITLANYPQIRVGHFEQAIDKYMAMAPMVFDWARLQGGC